MGRKIGCGSSPLVRGQLAAPVLISICLRIIPARAGPTRVRTSAVCARSDHPRSCGANGRVVTPESHVAGSSPLVRGQRNANNAIQATSRIIPARAGPTQTPHSLSGRLWIIPARAGPTASTPPHAPPNTDHPRSCGANAVVEVFASPVAGSSPLVRGQLSLPMTKPCAVRIIPARAGPTELRFDVKPASADHPRSCGANLSASASAGSVSGSSPLVRGQLERPTG